MEWFKITDTRKKIIITQVANSLGLPPYAVEKDWWVTLALRATFELPVSKHLVFKGGTSLSKAWTLIERFSQRTFIEKVLLLHEEFLKQDDKIKPNRMSRHLYDIHRMMDTDFGLTAVKNGDLFQTIVAHRIKYTPIRNIDYHFHTPNTLNITPPQNSLSAWKQDYQVMKANMIYGDAPSFESLLKRMEELTVRFSQMTLL